MTWGKAGEDKWIDADILTKPLIYSTFWVARDNCKALSGRESMEIITGIANYDNCEGDFRLTHCYYTPAILEYEVKMQGHPLKLRIFRTWSSCDCSGQ
jgi:hypothetical protein